MKKLIAICLAMLMCLTMFAACGDKTETPADTTPGTNASTENKGTEATEPETAEQDTQGETAAPEATPLENAKAFVKNMYNGFLKDNKTGTDYTLVPQVMVANVAYKVTWTVNTDKVVVTVSEDGKTVTVDVNEDAVEELAYVLTATIADPNGETITLSFDLVVPKFKVNTFAEYAAAEDDANVAVQGIITGVFSKTTGSSANGLYIQDEKNEGGYYVYNLTDDPNGVLLPGMTVLVRGKKDLYNGTYEVVNASVQIVDSTIKQVTPVDYTELIANAETLNDAALVEKQGMLVTIKGVTIKEVNKDKGYYHFQAGNLKTYLRISSSNNATSKEALETIKTAHAANMGNFADVTGIISIYNGNFYLSPVSADAFSNFVEPTRTDAEKIDFEISNVTVDTQVNLNKVLDLPTTGVKYNNVTITWTSDNACAVVAGGKVTITLPEEATKVTLTAVYAIGEITKTVTYEIAVAAAPTVVPSVVTTPAAGTAYKFFLTQNNLGKNLYFAGEMNGYYFKTTENYEEATDVFVEVVDGGYKLYFMNGETKTYISVVNAIGNDGKPHINVVFNAETPSVFAFNTEYNTFTTAIEGTDYYLGTYGTYNTISASKLEKIDTSFPAHLAVMIDKKDCQHVYSGDCDATCNNCDAAREATAEHTWTNDCDAECDVCKATRTPADHVYTNDCDTDCNVCGAGRTPADHVDADGNKLCDVCEANLATAYGVIAEPKADTAYLFYLVQVKNNKTLYLDGGVSGRYLTTTTDTSKAVSVYAEAVEGGYKFYILNGEAKNYIVVYMNSENKVSIKYDAAGDCVYKYNAETFAWATTVGGTDYYLGTYNNFDTISASLTSYINASNTRTEQFPLELLGSYCTHAYKSDCDVTCEFCGDANRADAADHNYNEDVTAPTCQNKGYTTFTCPDCGYTYTGEETDKVDHSYVEDKCQWCGEPAHEHSFTSETTPATCTAQGYTTYTCACSYSYTDDYTEKLDHTYVNPQVTPPTCTTKGYTTSTCTCGETEITNETDMIDHADVTTVDGFCDTCGKNLVSSLNIVDEPVAETGYFFYLYQGTNKKTLYLNGGVSGKYLTTTTDIEKAVKVYVEVVEGGVKLYILKDSVKNYIDVSGSGAKYATTSNCVYTYDETTFAWVANVGGTEYYLGTYSNYDTVSASKKSFISATNTRVSQFPLELVTVNCTHFYSADCDTVCNFCAATREVETQHTWDNACDAECNVCKMTRIPADHEYDNNCDVDCNVCSATREAPHTWAGACSTKCTDCEVTREAGACVDADPADGTCDVCGGDMSESAPAEVTVSKTNTDIATIAGVTKGQNTGVIANKTINLDENISIICAKGSSTSDPCIYDESIRLYQNGATMTVKAANGKTIKSIKLTLATKKGGQGPIAVTGGTASALSNNTYTITVDENTSEVVIKTTGKNSDTRLYVAAIEVVYQ